MFKDILTLLGLVYRHFLLITLYFNVLEISTKKSDQSDNYVTYKFVVKKFKSTCLNGCTDILLPIMELLHFLNRT